MSKQTKRREKPGEPDKVVTSVYLTPKTIQAVQKRANAEDRSWNFIAVRAIERDLGLEEKAA